MSLPQRFFIIGAQKAGTTSLYHYLSTHPEILAATVKEPKFFLHESPTPEQVAWYNSLFAPQTSARLAFEASVNYTQYPRYVGVPDRIHAAFPDARLIYIVRHPIDRVCSSYLFNLSSPGVREHRPFHEAVKVQPLYVNTSSYYMQLAQYLRVFDRTRIHVVFFEELLALPQPTLRQVFEFLEVDPLFAPPNIDQAYNETRHRTTVVPALRTLKVNSLYKRLPWRVRDGLRRRLRTAVPTKADVLTPEAYKWLHHALRDDVARLAEFVGRDVPWDFPRSKFEA